MRGPIHLEIEFLFHPANELQCGCWRTSRPDLDNLEKAAMDALTDARAWIDDAQVCAITSSKFHAASTETPGARIRIIPLEERTA